MLPGTEKQGLLGVADARVTKGEGLGGRGARTTECHGARPGSGGGA